ncbi:Cysteine and histidine-rich domain-containing protein 1 [Caenorhabditis elegans]|uniref:Cysteine and histidine-rich domain-containing protein 1 n=1 Tax=Caenorhabditis elegans TaxID=6239 RepID=CHRD1_CAEEL|nr:Cysteine and histidine-rich domain-containing protein 1 [Caenorhabditis elegans]G5EEI8.1 RecName: Full=Cysteine and histidine-rich domain-containing protein 1; AltName: Full=CHORD domain-containing protein 1; Short=CHORD-containing protein 1; AltName: Full=Protein CHORD [Caenorhabditis elegans]AAF18435.1 CHORD containing protein [Caenorhabditis elegans]CCD66204.1 Cysteine and histidine-rich domain-containing protein 1 [Caenorhabditis elegans]|eukprot:NP_491519.1 CHORD Protein [Caenorhabditis elegans]
MVDESKLQCYHKGCGLLFDPKENDNEACTYHPGGPYFHDAYKIWTCCDKKSTDFGTWMNYKGCTRGKHSNEKPVDIVKVAAVKEIRPEKEEDVIVWKGLNKSGKLDSKDATKRIEQNLNVEVTPGATAAIEKKLKEISEAAQSADIQIGAPCRNNGCSTEFDGSKNKENCQHHPGAAIFHEGMKYWSCCNKKTSNFGAFLEQVGCTSGEHKFRNNEIVSKFREDWFSSNGFVTINVYCRGALPETANIVSDGHTVRVSMKHGFGNASVDLDYDLWDEVIPEESRVVIGERKVEISLKQKHGTGWPRLKFDPELDAKNDEEA